MAEFIRHEACSECGSSDGRAIYADGSYFCWVCNDVKPSNGFLEEKGLKKSNKKTKERKEVVVSEKEKITPEQNEELKSRTSLSGSGYRGISDDTLKFFGVRTGYDPETMKVNSVYYPCTENGELSGYKCRVHPKQFGHGNLGRTGKSCDLFGQFRFTRPGKYVLIVGGEHDQLAAFQMLQNYSKGKGYDYDTPVVSPTVGETGCEKQLAAQYDWFNQFEKIIIAFDNDDAGEEATTKAIKVLPKGKVFVAKWSLKDPNEMLEKGKEKQFIQDFYSAKQFIPAGVLGSGGLYEALLEKLNRKSIPLPSFLNKLENMLVSWELNSIGVLAAGTGAAKTTVANEILYDLIFNSPYKTGVVSLELDAGQYAQAMLSRHLQVKIANFKTQGDRLGFVSSDDVKTKADEVFKREDGTDRFMVLDERDGSIEVIKEKIEQMIISCGCQLIILDPVSDLFEGLPHEEQAAFMKWLKSMCKNYEVSFLLIAHIRKTGDGKQSASSGTFVSEEAIFGSGSLIKSASWVVLMTRDKYNTDPIVRNTTKLVLSKNRNNGVTGDAGELYYCNNTHMLYDKSTLDLSGTF